MDYDASLAAAYFGQFYYSVRLWRVPVPSLMEPDDASDDSAKVLDFSTVAVACKWHRYMIF